MGFTLVFKDVDSLEETDKQLLAEQHGLPRPVLDYYLNSLHIRTTPPYELNSALQTVARCYIALQQRLQQIPASDTQINHLLEKTLQAYQQANFDRVEALLLEIKKTAVRLAKEATRKLANTYLLVAAEASASNAMLQYTEHEIELAEYYYQTAIDLLPPDHDLFLAHYLHELAVTRLCFYIDFEGDDDLGIEELFRNALAIREERLPCNHVDIADTLLQLANFCAGKKRNLEAVPLFLKSLAIKEEQLGTEHPEIVFILEDLADSYSNHHEIEHILLRILSIKEKVYGPGHPDVADTLYSLAIIYESLYRSEEAELLYLRSIAIQENIKGKDNIDSWCLSTLANLYRSQERYDEAEPLYLRALAREEKIYGPESRELVDSLHDIAGLYVFQKRYEEAETIYQRALGLNEKSFGSEHQDVAESRALLAMLYQHMDRLDDAEVLYRKALAIDGPAESYLDLFIDMLRSQNRYGEADEWEARREHYIN